MTLLLDNNPILRQVSEPYTKDEIKKPETKKFLKDLRQTMVDNSGMGISAVQVGVLKQVFIISIPDKNAVCFNPKILRRSIVNCDFTEGCLSFPEQSITISRPVWIKVSYLDINGKLVYEILNGLAARVFQHEYDHLRGVIFTELEKS